MYRSIVAIAASFLLACTTSRSFSPGNMPASMPPAPPPDSITFATIGDFGEAGEAEAAVADLVHAWRPDFVVTVGDDNYQLGSADTIDANIGQYYHDFIHFDPKYTGPYAGRGSQEPRFFPTLGNHDWNTPGAQPYLDYFELPGNERYYSFRRGPVEFFALDSDKREPDGNSADSVQAAWCKEAMQKSTAPWKVVLMHHPAYTTGKHGPSLHMRWPFAEWGAHLVMAGHDHHYERLQIGSVPYLVVGASGAGLRRIKYPAPAEASVDFVYDEKHGALHVTADARSMTLRFYNRDRQLIDEHVLSAAP